MILGLISDIHGRFDALQIAYDHAKEQCDQLVCLGDIVNGGGDAAACMDFIRENKIPAVRGNHDDAWLAMCSFTDFGTPNHVFMRSLPTWMEYGGIILVHDDPALATDQRDPYLGSQGYILRTEQAATAFETAPAFMNGPKVVAIGHTHVPAVFTQSGTMELRFGEAIKLPLDQSCIINPGSVGGRSRSRLGNTYAIYNTANGEITFYQLTLPTTEDPWEDFFRRIVS